MSNPNRLQQARERLAALSIKNTIGLTPEQRQRLDRDYSEAMREYIEAVRQERRANNA